MQDNQTLILSWKQRLPLSVVTDKQEKWLRAMRKNPLLKNPISTRITQEKLEGQPRCLIVDFFAPVQGSFILGEAGLFHHPTPDSSKMSQLCVFSTPYLDLRGTMPRRYYNVIEVIALTYLENK